MCGRTPLPWHVEIPTVDWEVTDLCLQEGFRLDIRKKLFTGTRSPGRWWCHHSWKRLENEMWHFVMWLSGQRRIQSKVGLDGLVRLSQPE